MEVKHPYFSENFSKTINSLFNSKSEEYISDRRQLNMKLNTLLKRNKLLNHKLIKNFNYNRIYHKMKNDIEKYNTKQSIEKSKANNILLEINTFNSEYQMQNCRDSFKSIPNQPSQKIISKLFLKLYNKNKPKIDYYKEFKNYYSLDPLISTNKEIKKKFYSKDLIDKKDDSLSYVIKLDTLLNQRPDKNTNKEYLLEVKLRSQNIDVRKRDSKEIDANGINIPNHEKRKKTLRLRNLSEDELLNGGGNVLNKNEGRGMRPSMSAVEFMEVCLNDNKEKKEIRKYNQIEGLFNEYNGIRKKINEMKKGNETKLKYIYSKLHYRNDKLIQTSYKNDKLQQMDHNLLVAVNSFNK